MVPIDSVSVSDVPVLDESLLLEAFGDEPEVLAELRDLYIQHCPPLLEEIRQAHAAGDNEALASCAHSLKGASATYGAMRVSEISRIIEFLAKQGKLAEVTGQIEQLRVELDAVMEHISSLGA